MPGAGTTNDENRSFSYKCYGPYQQQPQQAIRAVSKRERDYNGAIQDFEHALDIDPNYEDAKQHLEKFRMK